MVLDDYLYILTRMRLKRKKKLDKFKENYNQCILNKIEKSCENNENSEDSENSENSEKNEDNKDNCKNNKDIKIQHFIGGHNFRVSPQDNTIYLNANNEITTLDMLYGLVTYVRVKVSYYVIIEKEINKYGEESSEEGKSTKEGSSIKEKKTYYYSKKFHKDAKKFGFYFKLISITEI